MRRKKGNYLIAVGLMMIAAALCLTGYNLQNEQCASEEADAVLRQISIPSAAQSAEETVPLPSDPQELQIPDYQLNLQMEMPTSKIDGRPYIGVIELPSVGITLPVQSEWSEDGARISPCRYTGSAYTRDLIVAGHNYRSQFGACSRMSVGDPVQFTDLSGNRFCYTVSDIEVIDGNDVQQMIDGGWALTLFTCTYGGKSRIAIRCTQNSA